jgi:hypothetical protein
LENPCPLDPVACGDAAKRQNAPVGRTTSRTPAMVRDCRDIYLCPQR